MNGRILLLAATFPPFNGGIASLLYVLAKHLPAHRITVAALPAEGWQAFDSRQPFPICRPKIPVSWQKMSWRFNLLAPWYLWSILRYRPQFILCGQPHLAILLPAWHAKHLIGVPYGVFLHGADVYTTQDRALFYRRLFTFLLKGAAFVIPNSHATEHNVVKLGVNPKKLNVIYPAIDPDNTTPKRSPNMIKALHGVQGKRIILYIGKLIPRKGADKVLEAMPHVLSRFPDAHLLIIGRGPYEEALKHFAESLGLQAAVTFIDVIPHDQIADYFATCEFFIMVSREPREIRDIEGFGIVYLEVGLLGKPVIGGRSGGTVDAVADRKTGLLVDPFNISEIAGAMKLLLGDTALAKCLGDEGRSRVLDQFTGTIVAQKILTLIEAQHE